MYTKTLKGLNKIVQLTALYKDKRYQTDKNVLIDKTNLFVSYIINSNFLQWDIQDFEPVSLNAKILASMLGDYEYIKIARLLKDSGIITIDHSYLPQSIGGENAYSKQYGLTEQAKEMGLFKAGLLSKRMVVKITNSKLSIGNQALSDPIHGKILKNLFQFHFREEKAQPILDNVLISGTKSKREYYQSSFDMLSQMNNYTMSSEYFLTDGFYYTVSDLVGRSFHYISTVPKSFRKCLIHNSGETLAEIDLSNSQPMLLGLEYLKTTSFFQTNTIYRNKVDIKIKENRNIDKVLCYVTAIREKEGKKLFKTLIKGKLYEKVAEMAKKHNDLDFYTLFTEDYSEFKKQVLAYGFYNRLIPLDHIHKAEKYLLALFPNFMMRIRKLKKENNYKVPSIKAQTSESGIFVYDFFKIYNGFGASNHDSILTTKSNAKEVESTLQGVIQQHYPILQDKHSTNLFKTEYYG